jgi:hypothetical protein
MFEKFADKISPERRSDLALKAVGFAGIAVGMIFSSAISRPKPSNAPVINVETTEPSEPTTEPEAPKAEEN